MYKRQIYPLVISWGYESENPSHSQFLDYLQWQGTNDMSAYLTIPSTINFLKKYNWEEVSKKCRKLNLDGKELILNNLDATSLCSNKFLGQMCSFFFPFNEPTHDHLKFYQKYNIQIPFWKWNKKSLFRISIQAYNDKKDIIRLINALKDYRKNINC